MLLVRAVVKRRTRRGAWAYILWLLAYLPPMVWIAGGLSFHVRPYQMLPLLIPIVVVLVQMVYPTLLGWAVIVIPSVFFAGIGVCAVVLTAPARYWQHDLAGLVISSVVAGLYSLALPRRCFRPGERPAHHQVGSASGRGGQSRPRRRSRAVHSADHRRDPFSAAEGVARATAGERRELPAVRLCVRSERFGRDGQPAAAGQSAAVIAGLSLKAAVALPAKLAKAAKTTGAVEDGQGTLASPSG